MGDKFITKYLPGTGLQALISRSSEMKRLSDSQIIEQKDLNNTLIMFRVIHSGGLFKTIHQNISEEFLRLSDVKHADIESSGTRWQQRIEITLTRTSDSITDNKYLRALHMRRDDKMTIEFLKKIPQNLV